MSFGRNLRSHSWSVFSFFIINTPVRFQGAALRKLPHGNKLCYLANQDARSSQRCEYHLGFPRMRDRTSQSRGQPAKSCSTGRPGMCTTGTKFSAFLRIMCGWQKKLRIPDFCRGPWWKTPPPYTLEIPPLPPRCFILGFKNANNVGCGYCQ